MKILLVRPVTSSVLIHNLVPPLGLSYLAAALMKRGHEVSILDCPREGLSVEDFTRRAAEYRPGAVGFHTFSCDVRNVRESAAAVRAAAAGAVIVAGGAHPSGAPERFYTDFPDAHFGFIGEAEESFARFVDSLAAGAPDLAVPGLIFRKDGATAFNPPEFREDLSSLEFPAWRLTPPSAYPGSPMGILFRNSPVGPILATRGCPCACTFCAGRLIQGDRVRRRTVDNVAAEIRLLTGEFGVREIHFLDDNLASSRAFAIELCDRISSDFPRLTWCCPNGLRLDTLDRELLAAMKESGCYSISAGIESGSPEILKKMKKGVTVERIREKVEMIKSVGLEACGFFILGFPGETSETIEETISFACSLPLDRASFFNFLPLPGSPAAMELEKNGEAAALDYNSFHYIFTPYVSPGLTADGLKKAQREAFKRFFLRPRILLNVLLRIRTWNQIKLLIRRASGYLR